jgi:hypothetical protein
MASRIILILVGKNLTYFWKWKSVIEIDVIKKSKFTNLHVYSYFLCRSLDSVEIKLLIFSNLMAFQF